MVRIFATLTVFAVILLAINLGLGLVLGDFGQSTQRYANATAQLATLRQAGSGTNEEIAAAETAQQQALESLVVMQRRFRPHWWLGVASSLVAVLVNCISVTYFIGTSRWCREVVEAYDLDWELAERSRRLKRRSFPFAFLGLATTVGIAALGAAADPAARGANAAQWVLPHALGAMAGLVVIAVAFYMQAKAVAANFQVIQTIMHEAQRIRSMSAAEVNG